MYGTVARLRLKPGTEQQIAALMKEYESLKVPGHVSTTTYRMDNSPDEYYMAVVFDNKDAYTRNANDPAQDARYRKMRELLAADPEWHDGEVIYQGAMS